MITIKQIRAVYPDYVIRQIDSKQLFIITKGDIRYLVSYLTIVGKFDLAKNYWILTTIKYSSTTSKQLSQFANAQRMLGNRIEYSDKI